MKYASLNNSHNNCHSNYTNRMFLQKHMFRSIDRRMLPTGRVPWIILRLWGFIWDRDAGRRGNKITGTFYRHCWFGRRPQNWQRGCVKPDVGPECVEYDCSEHPDRKGRIMMMMIMMMIRPQKSNLENLYNNISVKKWLSCWSRPQKVASTKEAVAISSFSVYLLVLSIPLHSHKIRMSFNAVFFVLCFLVVYKEWKYLSNQFRYRGKLISFVY